MRDGWRPGFATQMAPKLIFINEGTTRNGYD